MQIAIAVVTKNAEATAFIGPSSKNFLILMSVISMLFSSLVVKILKKCHFFRFNAFIIVYVFEVYTPKPKPFFEFFVAIM